ncbi:MAG TPA: S-layer homology domain-containing protein [Bacillota bacterium]|nr:S-layer homology domain-containing protein [Bacillota bacterium]
MWLKRLAIALLAGVMLIMVLPVGATANNELYPTVDLWFTRNPNDSTKGTLYVRTTNGILGYSGIFAYQAGNSSSWKEVEIYPDVVVPVEISGLPTNSNYTITYCTYYPFYPYLSPFKTFTISPQSGSSSGTHVSIISSSRSGSSVIVSLNVLEPCTFYYSDNSNMNNKSSCFLPEVRPMQLPLENYSSNVVYYYTERQVGGNTVKSDVKYFIVGTSGSGSATSGYPVLTNCSFVLTSTNKGTFYCTSDRAGVIFYTVATSPPESSFYPTGSYNLQPGTNSFTIEDSKLSQSGAKVYYYTVGSNGSMSSRQSISVGTPYPVLSDVQYSIGQLYQHFGGYGGLLTFNSSARGYISYGIATDQTVTKNSPIFSTIEISQGYNSIPIFYTSALQYYAPLYFYTSLTAESPLFYISPNTSTAVQVPDSSSTVISSVNVNTSKSPAAGEFPSSIAYSTSDNKFTVTGMEWYKYNASSNKTDKYEKMGIGEYFLPGNTYAVEFTVAPKSGYTFPSYPSQFTASVNGKSATLTDYSTSSAKFRYAFDKLPGLVEIKNVVVYGIDDPAAGKSPDTSGTPGDSSYYISSITWNPTTSQFKAGNTYTVQVTLMPASGYKFNVESAKIGYRNAKIESKSADRVVISYNYWVNPFTDVREYDVEPSASNPDGKPNRYYVFIKYCYLNKLFVGTSDTTFSPDATMTRAMFVTVLGRLAGVNVSAYKTDKFTDVKPDALYAPYVAWAVQNKIVVGKTENTFAPDDPVTREQVCELLRRYAVYAGINLKFTARSIGFPDANKVSDYAKAAVSIFEQAGVALPRPNSSNFFPQENAQRKEIAEMLILFMMQYLDD